MHKSSVKALLHAEICLATCNEILTRVDLILIEVAAISL